MHVGVARIVLAVLAAAVLGVGVLGLRWGVWLLTTDDPDGGAHAVGLLVFPSALAVALAGLGLFALAIRR